jgi:hypothetical protein
MLEFSKWLNENTGKGSPRSGGPKPGSPFQPTKTPGPSSNLDDFDLEPTPEVDKEILTKAGDNFLKELDLKITRMIGKTLNAYKNKDSDAFNRAAITLEKYHEELKNRYSNWMNKLISKANKAPSPPPMNFNEADQRYSLGAYAQQMYMVAKKIWEDWIHTFLIEKDPALKSAKTWFAINSGYKDIVMKVPQYKKVERLADGSLDLSQFIKIIQNSKLGEAYKNSAKVKEQVDRINELPFDEYKELFDKVKNKFRNSEIKNSINDIITAELERLKAIGQIEKLQNNSTYEKWLIRVILGGVGTTMAGVGIVLLSSIMKYDTGMNIGLWPTVAGAGAGGAMALAGLGLNISNDSKNKKLYRMEDEAGQRKDSKQEQLKKDVAKEFLNQIIYFINEIGKETANRYMGSVK